MESSNSQDTSNRKVWKKVLIPLGFWLAIFISSLVGALAVISKYSQRFMDDWVFFHDRKDDLKSQHSQYLIYAMYATDLKNLAEKKDYKAILNKSCWLLLISTPKLTPEVWDVDSPRRIQDEKYKKQAQEALQKLFESGYCTPYTREDIQDALSK